MARKSNDKDYTVNLSWRINGEKQYASHSSSAPSSAKAIENAIFATMGRTSRETRERVELEVEVICTSDFVEIVTAQPQKDSKQRQLLLF